MTCVHIPKRRKENFSRTSSVQRVWYVYSNARCAHKHSHTRRELNWSAYSKGKRLCAFTFCTTSGVPKSFPPWRRSPQGCASTRLRRTVINCAISVKKKNEKYKIILITIEIQTKENNWRLKGERNKWKRSGNDNKDNVCTRVGKK